RAHNRGESTTDRTAADGFRAPHLWEARSGAPLAWRVDVVRATSFVSMISGLLCATGALLAPVALAAPERISIEGYVVELQESDIVIDLAASDGAADGDVIELWRPVKLRHPVTGRKVT